MFLWWKQIQFQNHPYSLTFTMCRELYLFYLFSAYMMTARTNIQSSSWFVSISVLALSCTLQQWTPQILKTYNPIYYCLLCLLSNPLLFLLHVTCCSLFIICLFVILLKSIWVNHTQIQFVYWLPCLPGWLHITSNNVQRTFMNINTNL